MKRQLLCILLSVPALAFAQLPAGPKVTVSAVTQVAPTLPQYTRVDVPILRDGVPKASGGRVEFNLKSWPEMSVQGPEVIRLVRSGQVDMGATPLTTVSGDVPFLDGIDLAGLAPELDTARKIANALLPIANKELERVGVKLLATYPFPAQVFFCKKAINGLADLKGAKVRTNGPSASDLVSYVGGQPAAIAFGEVYTALERGTVDCAITGTGSGNGGLLRQPRLVEQARPGGARLPREADRRRRGRAVEARRRGHAGRHRLQHRQRRGLQDLYAGEEQAHGGGESHRRRPRQAARGPHRHRAARLGEALRREVRGNL